MSRQHADELLARLDKASEEATKVLVAQHGTDAAEAARRAFDLASARRHGAIAMLEAMTLPAEGAPKGDHARAFARGYVIAAERPLVPGDYPAEGHPGHGAQSYILAMGMGAAYAAARVEFWSAWRSWEGRNPGYGRGIAWTSAPEFPTPNGPLTYHEIRSRGPEFVAACAASWTVAEKSLYLGCCEGQDRLEATE